MTAIHGNNVIVSLIVDDTPFPILCATDMNLNIRQDILLATTASTGVWRRKRLRGLSEWTVTVTGLTKIDNSDGQVSFFYLLQQSVRGAEQNIRIDLDDDDGNEITISGVVIIPELSINGPEGDFSEAEIIMEGAGTLEMETIPPPAEGMCEMEDTLYLTLAEGATYVESVLLQEEDAVIISVSRSGDTHTQTVGTPGSQEFKFTGANGRIAFDTSNPGNPGGEPVVIMWKIDQL